LENGGCGEGDNCLLLRASDWSIATNLEYLAFTILPGVLGYLIKNYLGATARMSRAILSLRYCAQFMVDVSNSSKSDNDEMSTSWKKLLEESELRTSAMKVLSAPYLIPTALFIQHELLGLKKEKTIGSGQIKDFAKYVVRAGRLHVDDRRDPNKALERRCKVISFYGGDKVLPSPQDCHAKQMKSVA
jgi:hypothetical protein